MLTILNMCKTTALLVIPNRQEDDSFVAIEKLIVLNGVD